MCLFSLNSVLYVSLHIHSSARTHTHTYGSSHTLTYTDSYSHLPTLTHTHSLTAPTASVHVCPVPGRGVALRGVRVAAGGAAWRCGDVGLGMGGGTVPGGEGSLIGAVGRRGSRPAEKTSPGDLVGRRRGQVYILSGDKVGYKIWFLNKNLPLAKYTILIHSIIKQQSSGKVIVGNVFFLISNFT